MTDAEKAKALTSHVETELDKLVDLTAEAVGVEKKWVLAEIIYTATQRMRAIGDPRSFRNTDTGPMPPGP